MKYVTCQDQFIVNGNIGLLEDLLVFQIIFGEYSIYLRRVQIKNISILRNKINFEIAQYYA